MIEVMVEREIDKDVNMQEIELSGCRRYGLVME